MTPRPSKIVCVGKNFHAHAAELGSSVPSEPLIFLKPPSSLIASGDVIVMPEGVGRVDYEGEIAVRIGTSARHVSEAEAWNVIDGVFPLNDVTARDLQAADDQWSRAKGFDTFCPVGTASTVAPDDFPGVTLVTRVNGEERQRAQASQMVFSIPNLIAYITRIMTLEPGDIVSPGTPEGVGSLSPGDEVEVELEGLDILRNRVEGEGDVGS
jgi:2-keto-4-pentenoate hydratase/2-oxohepta-3-ene-1,7-dioic acid hydratase in catechol pathway